MAKNWDVVPNMLYLQCLYRSGVKVTTTLIYIVFCSLVLTQNRREFSFWFCYMLTENIDEP